MDIFATVLKSILTMLFLGLGVLLLLGTFAPGGFTARVVLSGSMEPAVSTGSVVFTMPMNSYVDGEIITFKTDPRVQTPTTHRIVAVKPDPLGDIYTTKGDANDTGDLVPVRQGQVMGKVLFHVPYFGYVLDFAKRPLGFVFLIGLPALLIVVEEVKNIVAEVRLRRQKIEEETTTIV